MGLYVQQRGARAATQTPTVFHGFETSCSDKDELDPHSLATGIHLSKKIESGVAFVAQEKV